MASILYTYLTNFRVQMFLKTKPLTDVTNELKEAWKPKWSSTSNEKNENEVTSSRSWSTLLSRKSKLMWKMSIVTCSAWMRSLKWSHFVRLAAWIEEKMSFLHLSINVQSDYTFTGKDKHTDLKQTFRVIYFCVCLSRENETADEMSYHVIWLNSCISVWWVYRLDW